MNQKILGEICKHFKGKPVEYADKILGIKLSTDQKYILESLTRKPYRTLVRSCNNAGKSFIAAVAALYAFDCYDPSIIIVTAPVFRQIAQIVFKEIRTLGIGREGFSPKAPLLFDHHKHMIVGNTASDATAFQGIHDANIFIIADELVGIEGEFIEAMWPMLNGIEAYFFLGLFNPTDQGSHAFNMEHTGAYHVIELNGLLHDNIKAELAGYPAPFPSAIRLDRLKDMISLWCDEVPIMGDGDFEFDGKIWHPSPVAEARILGRWPTLSADSIWTLWLFEKCCNAVHNMDGSIQIGCDVAAFGDDDTAIAVRKGKNLIHVELHNGWSPMQVASRLRTMAEQYHKEFNLKPPEKVPVVFDDTGVGAAMRDMGEGYYFIPINFAARSYAPALYRHRRDEIHFTIADQARFGNVSFNKIPRRFQDELRIQLLAPKYKMDYSGRRLVEAKNITKELIGKSPDLADAVMLAFMRLNTEVFPMRAPVINKPKRKHI